MSKRTNNKPKSKFVKAKQKKAKTYSLPENSHEFYIAEETANYGRKETFTTCYKNQEPFIRLLKGDCVAILNHARENSVDMIFADPPVFSL